MAIERSLHPKLPKNSIQANVRSIMKNEFQNNNSQEGKELVKNCGVLLLPKWSISNAIRRAKRPLVKIEELLEMALRGSTFSQDWDALAIWLLSVGSRKPTLVEPSDFSGQLLVKRVVVPQLWRQEIWLSMLLGLLEQLWKVSPWREITSELNI